MPKNNRAAPLLNSATAPAHGVAETVLLKAGALQNAILNSASLSLVAADTDGVIRIFNIGAERMLGYTAADVLNKFALSDIFDRAAMIARARTLSGASPAPIPPGFEALVFKAAQGIEDVFEQPCTRKDGSRFAAAVSVSALRDAQDVPIGYMMLVTDSTALKQIRVARKYFDQQFYTRSLIESNPDAMIATDLSGIITDVNRQMETLAACPRAKLIGTPFKNHFTDPEQAEAAIQRVLSEKLITDCELTARASDGRETTVSCNAATFEDCNGNLLGVFADARDVTQHKQAEQQILQLAFHDALTQLPNRRMLVERLAQAMAVSKRSGRYGALIFLDLDNFKLLNDTRGHCTGDLLLTEVARRITSSVREVDFAARFGGDEFVVILGDLDADKAVSIRQCTTVADKIRAALSQPYALCIKTADGAEATIVHHCTTSIGIAMFLNHEVATEEVIRWADMAMYQAKESGGNSIRFYET